ncbi:NUDIX hydrolase [Corynebacterium liangguodongii]|uniref:CoA pyrophosphatase n=1 Tax=Corynebacterium liangguodongii TaxID=2079535 RepID=A0A2S0WC15_9CORY|nr:CoA pyrophosphatase [Corynebacterium liangguodongii]AWB83222.1 CoA pyrophosphatase [Corynebacterium liangguodongii]PWB98681.1 CoA pyrophosphatase [Corynebacterium liangguodongii]
MADIALRPELAPAWLATMLDGLRPGAWPRRRAPRPGTPDQAAVLMALTGASAAEAKILLTHRAPTLRSHSGQMAFPGGHIDPGDGGPVEAALREAWEETGLEPARVTPLASLPSVVTGGSGRVVRPILAYAAQPGQPYPASPAETDDVFFAAVSDLLDPACRLEVGFAGFHGPAFRTHGYLVWGFTGMLIDALFTAAGWQSDYDTTVVPLGRALEGTRNGE